MSMSRLRSERGFSLPEVMITMVLMLIVLGATLAMLSTFERTKRTNEDLNDAQIAARNTSNLLARSLRNMASPTEADRKPIDLAAPFDLVFISVDPSGPAAGNGANTGNHRRERYCYDGVNDRIVYQRHTWNTAAPTPLAVTTLTTACPSTSATWQQFGAGGPRFRVMAEDVVNDRGGAPPRELFEYGLIQPVDDPTTPTVDESDLSACAPRPVPEPCLQYVSSVRSRVFTDVNSLAKRPTESTLESGVIIRNQNGEPVADGEVTGDGTLFLLNATLSFDPEGELLTYRWTITYDPDPGAPITINRTGPIVNLQPSDFGLPSGSTLCDGPGGAVVTIELTAVDTGGLTSEREFDPPCE